MPRLLALLLATSITTTVASVAAAPSVTPTARIANTKHYSRGSVDTVKVVVSNPSGRAVKIKKLELSGCPGTGEVMFAKPLQLGAHAKRTMTVKVTNIKGGDTMLADCTPGDGWYVDLRVVT